MARTLDHRRQRIGAVVAALWLGLVLAVDLAAHGPAFVPAVLYGLAPLIACSVLHARTTALFALAAIALAIITSLWDRTFAAPQMWLRIADLVLISAAAVTLAALRVRREQELARLERIAEVAQRAVLPRIPSRVGPVAIGARYVSAAEDALVGGDLYDWFHTDQRICFIVGDVRGKGVGAVEQAARVTRAFRQSAASADLATSAADMSTYLTPFLDDEEFVTAALAQVSERNVTLVSCGHPRPLLIRGNGDARMLNLPPGLPLGLGRIYESVTLRWTPGDRVLMYTDGLSEARDAAGEFLEILSLAPLLRTTSVDQALDRLLNEVSRHVPGGEFTDDLAVLLLENAPGNAQVAMDPRDSLISAEPATGTQDHPADPNGR